MSCTSAEICKISLANNLSRSREKEIHSSGDDTLVINLLLFDGQGWDPIGIFQDSDSDLSRDVPSEAGFSDTSTGEASSESSSDGNSNEANEQHIDIDLLLNGYEYPGRDLVDNITHHAVL